MAEGQTDNTRPPEAPAANREITITRVFDAPQSVMWAAWTDPSQIVHWGGPRGFTIVVRTMDVRPGGLWESTVCGPDGTEYLNRCVFTDVVKPERIAYTLTAARKDAGDVHAEVSWIFEARGERTRLTLHMLFPTAEARDRAVTYKVAQGGYETLDRLGEHVASGLVH